MEIRDHWEESVKEVHRQNRERMKQELVRLFGEAASEHKLKNFADLGPKGLSMIAFHNRFFEQVRVAFVVGAYYPALTGACALGERILNYLILALRDDFKHTPEYKHVYRKESFDDWSDAIDSLEAWDVLLPDAATPGQYVGNFVARSNEQTVGQVKTPDEWLRFPFPLDVHLAGNTVEEPRLPPQSRELDSQGGPDD
jgi:hypothetical protein